MILLQLANSGDEVLLFYNDNSFHTLVGLMKAEGPLSGISYTHNTAYSMYTVEPLQSGHQWGRRKCPF